MVTNLMKLTSRLCIIQELCTNGCREFTNLKFQSMKIGTNGCVDFTNWRNWRLSSIQECTNGQRIHQFEERHPRLHQRGAIWRKASKNAPIGERIHQFEERHIIQNAKGAENSPVEIPDHKRMHRRMRRIHQFEERHHRMHQRVRRIHQFEGRHHPRMCGDFTGWNSRSWKDAPTGAENSPIWRKASSKNAPTGAEFTNLKKGIIQVKNAPTGAENSPIWRKASSKNAATWEIHQFLRFQRMAIAEENIIIQGCPTGGEFTKTWWNWAGFASHQRLDRIHQFEERHQNWRAFEERHRPSIQFK